MRLSRWIVLGCTVFFGAVLLGLQGQRVVPGQARATDLVEDVTLNVPDDPRPLAKMAELLELKFGIPVSYEDAPWVSDEETIFAIDHPSNRELKERNTNPSIKGPRMPKGGTLSVQLRMNRSTHTAVDTPAAAIQNAINMHRARGNPGDFRVVSLGQAGFSIVPTNMRSADGRTASIQSPFDSRISFPEADRTAAETMNLILGSASSASGYAIIMGGLEFYPSFHIRLGAANEVARDVLVKMLQGLIPVDTRDTGPAPMLAWRLLYAPGAGIYGMNIHTVDYEILSPSGQITKMPLWRPKSETNQ